MISLVLALTLGQYTAAEAQALFTEANEAYFRGDYATAEAKYDKLLMAGLGSPTVLFNLGTTELAAGHLGAAVLSLERAKRLSNEEDIEANLAVARQRQVDQVVGDEKAVPFTTRLADALDEHLASLSFLGTWWLGFGLAFLAWRRTPGTRLVFALTAGAVLLVASALGGAVAIHSYVRRNVVEAVVVTPSARVLEFPGGTAKTAFEVHAGLKVRLLETSGTFVRIRLPNALEGWTSSDAVVEL